MMLGARTGAWSPSGAPLPYDAEVEWIESTGQQWIDTGILAHAPLTFKCTARYSYDGVFSNNDIWGCSVRTPTHHFTPFQGNKSDGLLILGAYTTYKQSVKGIFIKDVWATITSVIDAPISTMSLDGTTVISISGLSIASINIDMTLPLFVRRHSINGIVYGGVSLAMASCELSKDGVYVRDLIPVRFTNENGNSEGAMFDKVSGQLFRNAGNGAFVIGPDKTT